MAIVEDRPDERIISRVRKLLSLAENNPDIHEAEAAAAKAQELIARHNIQQAFLKMETGDDSPGADIKDEYIYESGRVASWVCIVADALCEANNCAMYYTKKRGIHAVGEQDDIALVRLVLTYLIDEVQRLCKQDLARENNRLREAFGFGMDKSRGRVYANNFKMGASSVLNKRIAATVEQVRQETQQHPQGQFALTIIENKLQRAKDHLPELGKGVPIRYRGNTSAYQRGKRAGQNINLSPNRLRG